MRKSNSKEARRAVEAYVMDEVCDIIERTGEPEPVRPVTAAFNTLNEEMSFQSYHSNDRDIIGSGLAKKYREAGRWSGYTAATGPYWVWYLAVFDGEFEAYTGDVYDRLRSWLDETEEEAERYNSDQAWKLYAHMTASAFERLYNCELASTPATIAPALTGTEEFHIVFQQSRMVLFTVSYYTLGSNRAPYFTTTACKYNQNKSDIVEGGQAQNNLTTGKIRAFWKKWDPHHLKQLTDEEQRELAHDLESLKQVYNHIQFTAEKAPHYPTPSERRTLSMQEIKRNAAKEA